MRDSIRLGRLAGVRVGMHWSLALMVVMVATGLANNRFIFDAPGHSGLAYGIAGLLTAAGLLLGVLLHELGHALVARRMGLSVDGITLSWMGGVTRIEGDTRTAKNELLVAGVGPLVSFVVAGLTWAARAVIGGAGGGLPMAALGWLAWINLVLAVFNLLPAAPLDGGRVLHAAVWAAGRDRWRATRVAATTGVILGVAILVLGLVTASRTGNAFNGLIIGIIGWWMIGSARAELGTGAVHRALDGVTMADVMRPVGEAPGWITIRAFASTYSSARPGWVWLLQGWDGGYAGVLLGDSIAAVPYPNWDLARPIDVAFPISTTMGARPDEDALAALARSGGRQVILVVDGGHTVGAVLASDVEALVKVGGRAVPGRSPAPGRV